MVVPLGRLFMRSKMIRIEESGPVLYVWKDKAIVFAGSRKAVETWLIKMRKLA